MKFALVLMLMAAAASIRGPLRWSGTTVRFQRGGDTSLTVGAQ